MVHPLAWLQGDAGSLACASEPWGQKGFGLTSYPFCPLSSLPPGMVVDNFFSPIFRGLRAAYPHGKMALTQTLAGLEGLFF